MYPEEFNRIVSDIREMHIRGAARIAREAVRALLIASDGFKNGDINEYIKYIKGAAKILVNTRPTAVSLPNGLRFVLNRVLSDVESGVDDLDEIKGRIGMYVSEFIRVSKDAAEKISIYGSRRIEDGDTVMTHCNSSIALGIIIRAYREGKNIRVIATETRPRMQGLITADILDREGIEVTLIIDSAARFFMRNVDKVVVGADAVAANGAVINKIGTSMIALAAHEARVPFMVAAETYKFSPDTLFGKLIKIEERAVDEVVSRDWIRDRVNVKVRNPAFDATPPEYIDLIITELGVVSPSLFPYLIIDRYGSIYSDLEPWE